MRIILWFLPAIFLRGAQKPPNVKNFGCESQTFCDNIFYQGQSDPVTSLQNWAKSAKPSIFEGTNYPIADISGLQIVFCLV